MAAARRSFHRGQRLSSEAVLSPQAAGVGVLKGAFGVFGGAGEVQHPRGPEGRDCRALRVRRLFARERVGRMRSAGSSFGRVVQSGFRRTPAGDDLDDLERQRVQPRAVARQLELIRGVAQESMAEKIRGLGVHGA